MEIINSLNDRSKTTFSFEILPPLKGNDFSKVCEIVNKLRIFEPKCINITTHHSENIFKKKINGIVEKINIRRRPGTVAIAASIQNKYHITAVPHIICKGFTRDETEYALIDLQYLGVTNLLLLRGDIKKLGKERESSSDSHIHTTNLIKQVSQFNKGVDLRGNIFEKLKIPFSFGVACYPEKHEEALDMNADIAFLKKKVDLGAQYAITQMFFDNQKYFDFIIRCRKEGINIPIIPGIKPIVFLDQIIALPKIFRLRFPELLVSELKKCNTDEEVRQVGIEWSICQCKELMSKGVSSLHFYTFMATKSVEEVLKKVY